MARAQYGGGGQEQGPQPWGERIPHASEQDARGQLLQAFPVSSRSLSPLGLSSRTVPRRAGWVTAQPPGFGLRSLLSIGECATPGQVPRTQRAFI